MSFEQQIGDILKQLAAKNELHEVEQYITNLKTHHNNPVYLEARKSYEDTQFKAINKGAGKYPETLNPDSWTVDELAQHAWDELVDGGHYLTALKIKAKRSEQQLEKVNKSLDHHRDLLNQWSEQLGVLEKDNARWKNDCKEYAARLDMANDRLFEASQDIARLDDMIAKLIAAKDTAMEEAATKIAVLKQELDCVTAKANELERMLNNGK